MSHRSCLKKEDDVNLCPPHAHERTHFCTDTIIKMEKDSFYLFFFNSSSCMTLLALPAAGCLRPCSTLNSVCSSPARLCGDVSPSPCHSLPHLSHLTVYLLISSFLAFIFQTSFLLFSLLNFFSFITDPPYVSLCHLESEWQKYFGRLFSPFYHLYIPL